MILMNDSIAARRRWRGEKDPGCWACKGTGLMERCYIEGGTYKVSCEWCFEDNSRCSSCGGDAMICQGTCPQAETGYR